MSTTTPDPARAVAPLPPASDGSVVEPGLERLLARATHAARSAICITDAQLDLPGPRIIYVNPAFTTMTGYRADEVLGRDPRFLQGPLSDRTVLAQLRADLIAGRPFDGETYNYHKDGSAFRIAWTISAVHDEQGTVTHYVAAQEDVTRLRNAEDLLREDTDALYDDTDWLSALVSLSVAVSNTTEPDEVLAHVVDLATRTLHADSATFVLADNERDEWVIAHRIPDREPVAGSRFATDPDTLIGAAIHRQTPVYRSEADIRIGAGLGLHGGAVALLPVGAQGSESTGVLVLKWDHRREFRPSERTHLGLLAQLTTTSHRKTRALDDQRSLATEFQQALLPTVGDDENFEVTSRYRPASDGALVGGDWFDVVYLDDGRTAVFVGDVVGHGPAAAALMGEVRYTTRGLLRAFTEPDVLLDELDHALLASHEPGEALTTMCVVILDADGAMVYCSAGHPYPVIRRADGTIETLQGAQCRLVGATATGQPRTTARAALAPGDTLVAFSDGVFEMRDQDYDDAYDDLLARLRASSGTGDALCDAALADADPHDGQSRDDIVVLAVGRRHQPRSSGAVEG